MIYFIGIEGRNMVKVGRAINPKKRLTELAVAQPYNLKLLHTIKTHSDSALEKQIHGHLKKHHVRGEWFQITRREAKAAFHFFNMELAYSANPIIDGVFYLASKIEAVNGYLQTVTEPCFFCSRKHLHGAIDAVVVDVEGLQSYGHRVAHCSEVITREIHGKLVSNERGYYLWIRDREAEARRRQKLKHMATHVADPEYYYIS
jgi:hypothetical protein